MGVSADIIRSWRHPRRVMAARLSEGLREDRALVFLIVACLLMFVAQWPRLQLEALIDPDIPLEARLGGALMGWLFIAPLALYAIAALSRIIARLLGGQGSWLSARMALFWSLLAVTPLWLLNGLVTSVNGPGLVRDISGLIALAAFVLIWLSSMVEAETIRGNQ
ncbi:MAG: YIP1 family protein [Marinosulfonomonas sp.]|nr:MAG: YIP1 family protein [Marinosulfonomonas sp.]